MSGTLARKAFELINSKFYNNDLIGFTLIPYNYGKDPKVDKWLDHENPENKFDYYQFIDVTPPKEFLQTIAYKIINDQIMVDIFDHHLNIMKEIQQFVTKDLFLSDGFKYFFDSDKSGALIYYNSLKESKNWLTRLLQFHEKNTNKIYAHHLNLAPNFLQRIFPTIFLIGKIQDEFNYWFFSSKMEELMSLVSKYDTWQWYSEKLDKNTYSSDLPLALNEYFTGEYREDNFQFYYKSLFEYSHKINSKTDPKEDGNYPQIDMFTNNGYSNIQNKTKIAELAFHQIVPVLQTKICLIASSGYDYYYDTETVKKRMKKIDGDTPVPFRDYSGLYAVIYYKINFKTQNVKISIRSLNENNFDACDFVKRLTGDNGGGHRGAAGGSLTLKDFIHYTTFETIHHG